MLHLHVRSSRRYKQERKEEEGDKNRTNALTMHFTETLQVSSHPLSLSYPLVSIIHLWWHHSPSTSHQNLWSLVSRMRPLPLSQSVKLSSLSVVVDIIRMIGCVSFGHLDNVWTDFFNLPRRVIHYSKYRSDVCEVSVNSIVVSA